MRSGVGDAGWHHLERVGQNRVLFAAWVRGSLSHRFTAHDDSAQVRINSTSFEVVICCLRRRAFCHRLRFRPQQRQHRTDRERTGSHVTYRRRNFVVENADFRNPGAALQSMDVVLSVAVSATAATSEPSARPPNTPARIFATRSAADHATRSVVASARCRSRDLTSDQARPAASLAAAVRRSRRPAVLHPACLHLQGAGSAALAPALCWADREWLLEPRIGLRICLRLLRLSLGTGCGLSFFATSGATRRGGTAELRQARTNSSCRRCGGLRRALVTVSDSSDAFILPKS